MRKTSQDGGDSTSIMSGVENENKKPSAAVIKNKRNSIKRKVQTLSHESDDAVSEPLLQKDKEKSETVNQSAKFSMIKSKTDAVHNRDSDKDKLLPDNKAKTSGLQEMPLSSSTKENILFKSQPTTTVTLHNHMNTNMFSSIDTTKFITATKNQILVEIDGCKQAGYNPSPLIFTTAKIHTDSKTKQMEPVQVTAVPILSTTEITKTGKTSSNIDVVQPIPVTSGTKVTDKPQKKEYLSSTTFTAETNSKYNVSKATSENSIQNNLADRIGSSSLSKDSTKFSAVSADTKKSKPVPNKFEDKLSESHDPSKIEEVQKNNNLAKSFQSPLSHYKDVKTVNVSTAVSTVSNTIGIPRKPKTEDAITKFDKAAVVKKDTFKQEEGKIDENANANIVTVQQPVKSSGLGIKKSAVDSIKYSDMVYKDNNISKDITSITGNKQLPRQKNVIVEETGDVNLKSKPSGSASSGYSNNSKYSKDIDGAPTKSTTQSKMSDHGASDVSIKTLPKSSANNVIDNMTTKITATYIICKPTSTIKSTAADMTQCTVTTASVSATIKPTSSKIPSIITNTKTSIIPLTTSATISNKSQTSSSLSSVTPLTSDNMLATSSTKPSATGAVAQSSAPITLDAASSVKPANGNASLLLTHNVSTTTSNLSSSSSISLKSPTVKSTSTSSISTTSTTKPVTTTPAAKTSASSKKNGPKSNEVNKDSKSLKT